MTLHRSSNPHTAAPALLMALGLVVAVTLGLTPGPAGALAEPAEGTAAEGAETVPGETILLFEDDGAAERVLSSAEVSPDLSAELVADDLAGQTVVAVTSADDARAEALRAAAEALPGVTAQPNYRYDLLDEVEDESAPGDGATSLALGANLPSDPRIPDQYYLGPLGDGTGDSGANIIGAWDLASAVSRRSSVSVATIDTGLNPNHEDLQGAVRLDLAYDATTDSGAMSDHRGHGTMVAGVLAATSDNGLGIAGVGSGANGSTAESSGQPIHLIPVNVFGRSTQASTANLLKGLNHLDDLVESGTLRDLRVVNFSIGYYSTSDEETDRALHEAIAHLKAEHGVLCVGAGGNGDGRGNPLTDLSYPSDWEEVLGVTSLTREGANAPWADYNAAKDLSAPGADILSTSGTGSASTYSTMDGTSFSAPIVSGVAALLFSVNPDLTPDEAMAILKDTAAALPDPTTNDWGDATGSAGALDAEAALREAIGRIDPTVPDDPPEPDDPTLPDDPSEPENPPKPGDPDDPVDDPASGTDSPTDPTTPAETVTVWRLYNPYTREHHYTVDTGERSTLLTAGWADEGLAWTAPTQGTPVWRLYNPFTHEHHYTLDDTERSTLLGLGWNDEGIGWRSAAEGSGSQPVWRLYNPYDPGVGAHHYTTSDREYAELKTLGWNQEGAGWYGIG